MEFLTTSKAADYLRLGERKLYELVTAGAIPCSKVTGKWLFPRHELDLWVLSGLARPQGMILPDAPPIIGGSQDDLLEWSLRESGSGFASLNEGTMRGVERLQRGEVVAAARREQGLLTVPGNRKNLRSLSDVLTSGAQMAMRQPGAGAQLLLEALLAKLGTNVKSLRRRETPSLTGPDVATTIRGGHADCGIATRAVAKSAGLDFAPLL